MDGFAFYLAPVAGLLIGVTLVAFDYFTDPRRNARPDRRPPPAE